MLWRPCRCCCVKALQTYSSLNDLAHAPFSPLNSRDRLHTAHRSLPTLVVAGITMACDAQGATVALWGIMTCLTQADRRSTKPFLSKGASCYSHLCIKILHRRAVRCCVALPSSVFRKPIFVRNGRCHTNGYAGTVWPVRTSPAHLQKAHMFRKAAVQPHLCRRLGEAPSTRGWIRRFIARAEDGVFHFSCSCMLTCTPPSQMHCAGPRGYPGSAQGRAHWAEGDAEADRPGQGAAGTDGQGAREGQTGAA